MQWIDSHCHLQYDFAPKTADDLIREAHAENVSTLVNIGTEIASIAGLEKLSDAHARVFHTVGVHPHEAGNVPEPELKDDSWLAAIRKAAAHPKFRAVGELGLDYHYDLSPRDAQRERLAAQLALALELKAPIIVHSREAEADLLAQLETYAAQISGRAAGVIHCFTGTKAFAHRAVDLGFYISFSGIFTFKNAEDLREIARGLPLDRILVETDAPYLAPVPFRGKKCEPKMVVQTGLKLAEVLGRPAEEIARVTSANATLLFRL